MNQSRVLLRKWYIVFTFIFIIAPLIICYVPRYVHGTEGTIIRKIEVRGNKRLSTAAIKAATRIKEGDLYSPDIVNRDVDAIWAMGFFENIEVKIEPYEDGLNLIFILTERATITQIIFQGNDKLKDNRLKDVIELRTREYLKHYLLKLDEDRIKELYVKKGYHFAEIKSDVQITEGDAVVTFLIKEGPKVHVAKIVFEGNESVKDKKLKKQIDSRARRFPFIIFPGKFKSKDYEGDIDKIKDFYIKGGWLDTSVRGEIIYGKDKKEITIIFYIEEGERYFIDTITIQGNTIFSNTELRAGLKLREGDPFLTEVFEDDTRQMQLSYGIQGHLKASVEPRRFFTPEEAKVDISYEIEEGERFYIDKIKISGNDRTKDNVIRRVLNFYPGDRIDTGKMRDAHQRLVNTGFFDVDSGEPTDIGFEPGTEPNKIDIIVDVKEGQTGVLRFGGGFGANVGPFGDISYSDKNFDILDFPKDFHDFISGNAFRGAGHVITLRFSPGIFRQEAIFSFFNPALFDSTYSFGINFFLYQRVRETYDEGRKGIRVTVGKEIIRDLALRIIPSYEYMEIMNLEDDAPDVVQFAEGSFARFGLELRTIYDKRDNYYFPTKGFELGASLEATALDVKIARATFYSKKYVTLFDFPDWGKHILTISNTVGLVGATGTQGTDPPLKDVPIFERYFAGGYGSIRGFEFRGVSPTETTFYGEEQIGGKSLLLGSLEYSIPVYSDVFRAVTFIDTGKADEQISDINLTNMRVSTGFGVRMTIPFFGRAVIAIDYGIPIRKVPGDLTQPISFNMGSGTAF